MTKNSNTNKLDKILTAGFFCLLFCSSCTSIKQIAISELSNALASKEAMLVYTSDNDPELVWGAMPFALKTTEMLLANDPDNINLNLYAAKGYVIYAQGNLATQSAKLEYTDFKKSRELRNRAHNLSLRGRDYALKALDLRHPGFKEKILNGNKDVLGDLSIEDQPLLYWAAAGWIGATANDQTDMNNMAELPIAESLMKKALELDETYQQGAIHEFLSAYEAARAPAAGGSFEKAKEHFEKAVEISKGLKASPYVVYAESVAVKKQDLQQFRSLLKKALAIDPNKVEELRLTNTIAQDKAKWLLNQIPELFVAYEENSDE